MIATIRVRAPSGDGRFLCELDLLKFSEEQVRERMAEQGYHDDNFFVTGFSDWGVDCMLTLTEAYVLKRSVLELYEGDESVIIHLIKIYRRPDMGWKCFYQFISKDETAALKAALNKLSSDEIVDLFVKYQNPANVLTMYINQGSILNIPSKGYYALTLAV